jgi:hypothetical protein
MTCYLSYLIHVFVFKMTHELSSLKSEKYICSYWLNILYCVCAFAIPVSKSIHTMICIVNYNPWFIIKKSILALQK